MMKDYYTILGTSSDADEVVISAAYKALMRKFHPDLNAGPDATRRAAEINEAFDVLGNSAKRAAYDRYRAASQASAKTQQSAQSKPRPEKPSTPENTAQTSFADTKRAMQGKLTKYAKWALIAVGVYLLIGVTLAVFGVGEKDYSQSANEPELSETDLSTVTAPAGQTDRLSATDAFQSEAAAEPLPGADTSPETSATTADSLDIDEANIHRAALEFNRVWRSEGMIGAETYSRNCHSRALQTREWRDLDFCSAFNYAASYVDRSVTNSINMPINQYFATTTDARNQEDLYADGAGMGYLARDRGALIQRLAQRSIEQIVLSGSGAE